MDAVDAAKNPVVAIKPKSSLSALPETKVLCPRRFSVRYFVLHLIQPFVLLLFRDHRPAEGLAVLIPGREVAQSWKVVETIPIYIYIVCSSESCHRRVHDEVMPVHL